MSIDDAIRDMQVRIEKVSPGTQFKVVKLSGEEARLSVFVPASRVQPIREATLQPTLDYLNKDGLDLQVLVYDQDHPPQVG
jgi:hypothetical protein